MIDLVHRVVVLQTIVIVQGHHVVLAIVVDHTHLEADLEAGTITEGGPLARL